jgi:hypothetical protein
MTIRRPDAAEYDARYAPYLDLVPEVDLLLAMTQQIHATRRFLALVPESRLDVPFAAGEWTVREIVGHLLDSERIFGYRILCFARGDTAPLQRADENLYVRHAAFDRYVFADLLREFEMVRWSHIWMLSHLPPEAWDRVGSVSGLTISVRALAFLLLGHERHHLETVRTQYLGADA